MTPFIPHGLPTDVAEHGGNAGGLLEPLVGLGTFALVVAAWSRSSSSSAAAACCQLWPSRGSVGRTSPRTLRRILAERFAHGVLSTEEFMDRASALNWTRGAEVVRPRSCGRG